VWSSRADGAPGPITRHCSTSAGATEELGDGVAPEGGGCDALDTGNDVGD
jgi:hypothetical protein